jgi:hypothetical protein
MNVVRGHTQKIIKWLLHIIVVDQLLDTERQPFCAHRSLLHNRFDVKLYEASKTGNGEIQDWLIKIGCRAKDWTQDFLMHFVDSFAQQQKQGSKGVAYSIAMVI